MNGLLVVALALPLLGAVLVALAPSRTVVAPLAGGLTALAWAVLATAEQPAELGRIVASPLVAVTVAGTALLAATHPPATTLARSALLCGVTVAAVAAATGDGGVPDRALGLGIVVLSAIAALEAASEGGRSLRSVAPAAGVLLAGLVLAGGVLAGDGFEAVVAAGAGVVLVAVALRPPAGGRFLLPVAVLATARAADTGHGDGLGGGWPPLSVAGAAVALVTVAVLALRLRRAGPGDGSPGTAATAVVAAALALVAQDLADLRAAGLLLAAGAVLGLAGRHPFALVAALPGLAVAVEAFGQATEPVHALAGGAVVVALTAGALVLRREPSAPLRLDLAGWPVLAAGLFAVVPLWGWSGAHPDGYVAAAATAAAAAAVVVLAPVLAAERPVPTGTRGVLGRIRHRSNAANHGSTHPLEEDGSLEGSVEEPVEAGEEDPVVEDPAGEDVAGPPQHPVAVPARIVPRRAGAGGVGGRGRLRARPGRPPR